MRDGKINRFFGIGIMMAATSRTYGYGLLVTIPVVLLLSTSRCSCWGWSWPNPTLIPSQYCRNSNNNHQVPRRWRSRQSLVPTARKAVSLQQTLTNENSRLNTDVVDDASTPTPDLPSNRAKDTADGLTPSRHGISNTNRRKDSSKSSLLSFSALHSRRSVVAECTSSVVAAAAMVSAFNAEPVEAVAAAILSTNSVLDSEEARRIAVFEKVSPSVVFVDTFTERRDSLTTNIMEVPLGSGSGIVWDNEGHIVTNFHVIRNAQSAQVAILLSGGDALAATKVIASTDKSISSSSSSQLLPSSTSTLSSAGSSEVLGGMTTPSFNGQKSKTKSSPNTVRRVFTARIVGVDPGKDIAVLKIDADAVFLFPIALGTSQGIKVGQQALAIGNPFGLDHTLTSGIISGTGREVRSPIGRPITDVLQTDAAINPGNSGGPLLDSSGKLIGMNTAIYSPSGASAGIGFAIPVDAVKVIVETLIRDGQVVRPILGISYLGSKQARTLGISTGVLVLDVPPESPAARAGLKGTRRTGTGLIELGDIIVKVGAQMIDVEADLFTALEDLKPGDIVDVTVNRIVAVNDELQMKEVVLKIVLSSSSQVERNIMQQLYQTPIPIP